MDNLSYYSCTKSVKMDIIVDYFTSHKDWLTKNSSVHLALSCQPFLKDFCQHCQPSSDLQEQNQTSHAHCFCAKMMEKVEHTDISYKNGRRGVNQLTIIDILTSYCPLMEMLDFRGRVGALHFSTKNIQFPSEARNVMLKL